METVDNDLLAEVPDTPDRLAAMRAASRFSGCSADSFSHQRSSRSPNAAPSNGNSKQPDTDYFFRQASVALKMSEVPKSMPSHPDPQANKLDINQRLIVGEKGTDGSSHRIDLMRNGKGPCIGNGGRKGVEIIDLSSQKSPSSVSPISYMEFRKKSLKDSDVDVRHRHKGKLVDFTSERRDKVEAGLPEIDDNTKIVGKRKLFLNGYMAPCNMSRGRVPAEHVSQSSVTFDTPFSFGITKENGDAEVDLYSNDQRKPAQDNINKMQHGVPSRNTRQRRLVRNGCISPSNISMNKDSFEESTNGPSAHLVHNIGLDTQEDSAYNKKGKAVIDSGISADVAESSSNRTRPGKASNMNVGMNNGLEHLQNNGWRTTRNHTAKHSSQPASIELEGESGKNNGLQTQGRTNCRMFTSHKSEHSTLNVEGSEAAYLRSSRQPLISRVVKNRNSMDGGTMLNGVIEVDELPSPEVGGALEGRSCRVSDNPGGTSQVESDERLARQLQEQFYRELPGDWTSEEIDANIAWSLQREEDDQLAASFSNCGSSDSRGMYSPNIHARWQQSLLRNQQSSLRNNPARATGQVRVRGRLPRRTPARRQSARNNMDLDARLDYLEALETAFNMGTMLHDSAEDNYEMLLSLDENNHQHAGASERQINNLPESIVQVSSNFEACAVCLETPTAGETVRHLPCLHKFHKQCIDTWLRRKTCCPICKCDIA